MLQSTNPATINDRSTDPSSATFVVTLTAKPGQDGIRALRAFLKLALRRFGLRCIDLQETTAK